MINSTTTANTHRNTLHDNKSLESSVAMKYDGTFLAPAQVQQKSSWRRRVTQKKLSSHPHILRETRVLPSDVKMLSTIIPRENNRTLNPLAFLKPLFKRKLLVWRHQKSCQSPRVSNTEFFTLCVCLFGGDRAIIAEKKVDKNEGISQYNFALSPQGAFSSLLHPVVCYCSSSNLPSLWHQSQGLPKRVEVPPAPLQCSLQNTSSILATQRTKKKPHITNSQWQSRSSPRRPSKSYLSRYCTQHVFICP